MLKFIDLYRRTNSFGYIFKIIYDSNRTGKIGCILYLNGLITFIILAENWFINKWIYSGYRKFLGTRYNTAKYTSSAFILKNIPLFSIISMIELTPYHGSILCRAAGTKCLYIGKKQNKAIIKLQSKWQLKISLKCMAMLGQVSNVKHKFDIFAKAGKARAFGFKSSVRGVAKNPCDHPHGGGNGKKSPPCIQVTPWGKWTKNRPTTNTQIARKKRYFFKN